MTSELQFRKLRAVCAWALLVALALLSGTLRAAPTFQAAGTEVSAAVDTAVPWPAHQVGDIALLFIESAGGQVANLVTASGFAAVASSPQINGTNTRLTVYWARATSAAMASPVVDSPADHFYARILTYRGVYPTGNPWDVTGGGTEATGTTVNLAGVTTTVADTLIVQAATRDNDSAAAAFSAQANAALTGITERSDAGTTTGNGGGMGIWDGVKATAGATGTTSATVTSSANAYMTIALRPATTWYSRASTGWATTTTWSLTGCGGPSGTAVPPAGSDVVICAGNTVTLNTNSANIASLTVQATGILLIGDSATNRTLTVSGDTDNGGTLQFNNNNGDHTISVGGDFTNSGTFGNINNTNGGVRTTTIAGNLTNSGVFEFGGRNNGADIMSVTVTGNVVNTGTIDVDTASDTTHAFIVGGNVTNNGVFNLFTDANSLANVTFNGATAQTISGTSTSSNFHNLTLSNATGLALSGSQSIQVNTTLTLTSGRLTTNGNFVYVASGNAVAGAGANAFVVGNLRKRFTATGSQTRVFEVGTETGGNRYAPVSMTLGNITTAGDFTVSSTVGDHPSIDASTVNPALSINRFWTLANNSVAFNAVATNSITFTYVAADYDSGAAFASFIASRYNPPLWTEITSSLRTATSTTVSGTGITSANVAGEYQIGHQAPAQPTCTTVLSGGLNGDYFNNMTLSGSVNGTRVDGPVDFDWANGASGVSGINADQFSVRWTGILRITATGNYQFQTNSDDGIRLWVNNTLVIDNWTDHSATDNTSGNVALTAGQLYNIRMEFYENGGQAVARLRWMVPSSGSFVAIPAGPAPTLGAGLYVCAAATAGLAAHYTMDQAAWNGTAGEVIDISGNSRNGTSTGGATTGGIAPALVGNPGTCRYGVFDGTNDYVTVANLSNILNGTASMTFWIKTTQTGNDTGWQAPGVTGVEQSGLADDMFWGWLDGSGRIGLSVGNDFTTKSTVAINNGAWRHIALTRDHVAGTYKIYIDGVLNASGAIATGLIGTPWTSLGRIEDTGGTPEYLNGQLDEVRIYDRVLTDAEVIAIRSITRACAATINHYYVQHAATGVNCQAENVTITAHDVAHAAVNAAGQTITITAVRVSGAAGNHGDYTTTGTGTLLNGTADDGVAIYTFGPGETSVTLAFKDTWAQAVNFTVDDGAATDISGTASADANYNQNLSFSQSGFRFVDASGNAIGSLVQTAGVTSSNINLQAIQTSSCTAPGPCTGVCTAAFPNGGTVAIGLASKCVNPTTCVTGPAVPVSINGTAIANYDNAAAIGSYTSVNLNFGTNSTAPLSFNYPDVGQMSLSASYTIPLGTSPATASSNTITGSSAPFVVKPFGFVVSAIETAAGLNDNPAAADANGGVFRRAGQAFRATVTSIASGGGATRNYGKETSAETVRLTSTLVAPSGGVNPALTNPTAFGSFNNGVATGTTFAWGEVGIITLTPSVGDADYLGAGNVTGTVTGNVGRFIPDNFNVSQNAAQFRSACSSSFTYVGQPFLYDTGLAPQITVTARNVSGGTTQNYSGSFMKLANSGTSLAQAPYANQTDRYTRFDALGGGTTPTLNFPATLTTATDPAISVVNGTGTLTFGSGTGFSFNRANPVANFNADISLAINVIDSDGVVSASNPVRFGNVGSGSGIAFATSKDVRYGRVRLGNAFGSQSLDLPMPVELQYYNGTTYVTSTGDSCSTLSTSNFSLSGGTATFSGFSGVTGKGSLRINKPNAKTSFDVCVNVAVTAIGDTCPGGTPAAMPWLQWKWSGSTYDKDPAARATFGIFKNADEFIYLREMY